jgi:methyltransferase-like protein
MGKFNLSEAAKEVLTANVAAKKGGQDKPAKLSGDVAYGTKEQDVGHTPLKTTDANPDYTAGVPSATPPGATPPVGSEPAKKITGQPGQTGSVEQPEGKSGKQMMAKNPGATFQSYGEETEAEGEEIVAEEKGEGHEDEAEDKAMVKKMVKKDALKEKMKEDINALMSGENLSEEFVQKATTIFEAAVIARAEEVIAEAEAELQQQFEEAVEEIKEDLASKVDDYLNYMVEEWMKENEVAIEKALRAEIVEDFIGGLRDLFAEHYIDIPTEKVDVVEELTEKVAELETALNEQINRGIELTKEINEQKKSEAIYTACEGLSQTQVEKLKSLAENVEFTTDEEFAQKLSTLKESYFKADIKVADASALDDQVEIEDEKKPAVSADPTMDAYVKTISQTLVK